MRKLIRQLTQKRERRNEMMKSGYIKNKFTKTLDVQMTKRYVPSAKR